MNQEDKSPEAFRKKLDEIASSGIQADRQHLKRNMCTQFADPYEFVREYVVNAYDAGATFCLIKVSENETMIRIEIHDNGNGMDRARLMDFLTLFRSRKDNPFVRAVGRHGIGKLSVAALPGLAHFRAVTSTGTECHEFETESLLEDQPIIVKRLSSIPPQGTMFEITIRKNITALKMIQKLADILHTFTNFLPISVRFFVNGENWPGENPERAVAREEWAYSPECYGRSYNVRLEGKPCELVLGIGNGIHEIYQNRVFISSKYNLFTFGNPENIRIPNLMIRADSEAFELPFGRHCLCNEDILKRLAEELRQRIVPSYFDYLTGHFDFRMNAGVPRVLEKTDEMTIGLLGYRHTGNPWANYPVFRLVTGNRLSMTDLSKRLDGNNFLYIEAADSEGTDFSHFNGPVLSAEQPSGTLKLLETFYNDRIVDLNGEDTVIEMPSDESIKLSKEQKHFEKFLVFRPEMIDFSKFGKNDNQDFDHIRPRKTLRNRIIDYAGISEEARIANKDLLETVWKVNYLVERDGVTPCLRKKYMYRSNTIILNLFHSEIKEFVQMSTMNPNLAAHWAIAMCLSDNKILPHISDEVREDILIIDAITRIGHHRAPDPDKDDSGEIDRDFMDFVRNCINRTPGKNNPF